MTMQIDYGLAASTLLSYLDVPYIWGGQSKDPGLDCSGLVGEWWEDIGFVAPSFDTTADALWKNFTSGRRKGTKLTTARFGAMVFYGSSTRAGHVTIAINHEWVIGADGGSSSMDTVAEARAKGAEVRFDKINYHSNPIVGIWMPDYTFVVNGKPVESGPETLVQRTVKTAVNLRVSPSTSAKSLGVLAVGKVVVDKAVPHVIADGYDWVNVNDGTLGSGWCAAKYLS